MAAIRPAAAPSALLGPPSCTLQVLLSLLLLSVAGLASAQAGPPLITNDPDTPGDGHWEINLAVTGQRDSGDWNLGAPDLDINYGLGERLQLSMHLAWAQLGEAGEAWRSGASPVEFAVRWRIIDEATHGVSVAIQPHWATSFSPAAERKELAPAGDEFSLPVQVSRHLGKSVAGIEVGRNILQDAPDEWQAGVFWSRECARRLQCLAELNTVWAPGDGPDTIAGLGLRRELGEHAVLLGSLGRRLAAGPSSGGTVFYLGLQLLR